MKVLDSCKFGVGNRLQFVEEDGGVDVEIAFAIPGVVILALEKETKYICRCSESSI